MKPSDALNLHRATIRELVGRCRASNARVFGSVAEGNDRVGSDLDLLVDPLPDTTLFDLGRLQAQLEDLLGVPVDVLTPGDITHRFRDDVLKKAVPI